MSELCREFGISRKTGHKLWRRFQEEGPLGLYDRPRTPHRRPHKTPREIEDMVVAAREKHPSWGARKLRQVLSEAHPGVTFPARSTITEILRHNGLIVARKRRKRVAAYTAPLIHARAPNHVWCADYKGQFRMGDGKLCYPLTITDACSRYIIAVEAHEAIATHSAETVFKRAFRTYGVPKAIRTDNGAPFANSGSLAGLSRLNASWIRKGIIHERIEPGKPQQNGRHERMHLTLKQETIRPAARNILQQQERFDAWRKEFNEIRPHEALNGGRPNDVYKRSSRSLTQCANEPDYPIHDLVVQVYKSGHILVPEGGQRFFLSTALAGELVGLREVDLTHWLVTFGHLELGACDLANRRFQPA